MSEKNRREALRDLEERIPGASGGVECANFGFTETGGLSGFTIDIPNTTPIGMLPLDLAGEALIVVRFHLDMEYLEEMVANARGRVREVVRNVLGELDFCQFVLYRRDENQRGELIDENFTLVVRVIAKVGDDMEPSMTIEQYRETVLAEILAAVRRLETTLAKNLIDELRRENPDLGKSELCLKRSYSMLTHHLVPFGSKMTFYARVIPPEFATATMYKVDSARFFLFDVKTKLLKMVMLDRTAAVPILNNCPEEVGQFYGPHVLAEIKMHGAGFELGRHQIFDDQISPIAITEISNKGGMMYFVNNKDAPSEVRIKRESGIGDLIQMTLGMLWICTSRDRELAKRFHKETRYHPCEVIEHADESGFIIDTEVLRWLSREHRELAAGAAKQSNHVTVWGTPA